MGKTYAGILGSLAMAVAIVRGVMAHGGFEETIIAALVALIGFSLLGFVVGWLAGWIVEEAVYVQVQQELATQETPKNTRSENPTTR